MSNPAFDIPLHQSHELPAADIAAYKARIRALLEEKNAVLVAHYYTDDAIQELADETGAPLIPGVFSGVLSDESPRDDPIHPNAEGYKILTDGYLAALREAGIY